MYKYILIPILLLLLGLTVPAIAAPTTVSVMFINGNPGVTALGLAKFVIDKNGEKTDFKILNIRWTDVVKIIQLEPGVYGVTQYIPVYDKILSYQSFTVGKEAITVKFEELL